MNDPISNNVEFSYDAWRAGFLRVTLISACVIGLLVLIPSVMGALETPIYAALYVGIYVALLCVTIFNVPYQVKAGIFVILWFGLGLSGLFETGIWGDARVFMLGAISMAALLFSWKSGWLFTGLTMLSYLISGALILSGKISITSAQVVPGTIDTWLSGSLAVLILAVLIVNGIRLMQTEFTKAQMRAEGIFDQLKHERTNLEEKIIERTRAVETARAESEAARLQAESQAWFTRGQAQLAEKMRGEQSVEMLANNVTSHVCQYLGAHTGVLFITSDDGLKLAGRYAYDERAGLKQEFDFDENLVGETARTNRIIRVNDIPADAPMVSSALGEALPRQLLLTPIAVEGQVIGVMELATLDQFTAAHESFLERVSESVAIAFRTAQTRVQVNELLMQSQLQAQELQAQEEELRASNEELQAQAESLRGGKT